METNLCITESYIFKYTDFVLNNLINKVSNKWTDISQDME